LNIRIPAGIALCLALSACMDGTGVDTKLASKDEFSYQVTLNRAAMEMSREQMQAYNWAVSDLKLTQLLAKYPGITPRKVIEREADEYVARKTRELENLKADFQTKVQEQGEDAMCAVIEVRGELAKLVIEDWSYEEVPGDKNPKISFRVENDSRFTVSAALWDAWLLIGEEESSDRHGSLKFDYTYLQAKGLRPGYFVEYTDYSIERGLEWLFDFDARLNKSSRVVLKLDKKSVKDAEGNQILPPFSDVIDEYERKSKNAAKEIDFALLMKATLQ